MKRFRSRKELIRKYYENESREDTQRARAMGEITYIIDGRSIASEWDYVNVLYDDEQDILYGRPVKMWQEMKSDIPVYWLYQDEIEKGIADTPKDTAELCKWVNGLGRDTFTGITFERLELPRFIKDLERNSMNQCFCNGEIILPTHLLTRIISSGLTVGGECAMELIGTGGFGKNQNVHEGYTEYPDLLKQNENLMVYSDKLMIDGNPFINGFQWDKFYNSSEEMAISLLLAKFRVFINSDVTMAILDLYSEREK